MRVGYGLVGSPCYGSWCKVWHESVDGFHGLEFAMHHVLALLFGDHFDKQNLGGAICKLHVDSACVGPEAYSVAFGGNYLASFWEFLMKLAGAC